MQGGHFVRSMVEPIQRDWPLSWFVEWADPCVEVFEVYRVARLSEGAMSVTLYVVILFLT